MKPSPELVLQDVVAGWGDTTVLEQVSFTLRRGQRLGVIGRNGAGKTTTLATAMGLTRLRGGHVRLGGEDIGRLPTPERARRGLGYVPQTRDIFATLSVEDNLRCGLQGAGSARLADAYALFPRLKERRRNFGHQLSGGEQQMLSIARALMAEPQLLLMDEPLEGLSPLVAHEVMASIRRLVDDRGLGCVLVEQQVQLVLDFADTVLVMERGRPMFLGTPAELSRRPQVLEQCIGLRKAA
jgi:branched-chain amino acid transport system ATP-binding protein